MGPKSLTLYIWEQTWEISSKSLLLPEPTYNHLGFDRVKCVFLLTCVWIWRSVNESTVDTLTVHDLFSVFEMYLHVCFLCVLYVGVLALFTCSEENLKYSFFFPPDPIQKLLREVIAMPEMCQVIFLLEMNIGQENPTLSFLWCSNLEPPCTLFPKSWVPNRQVLSLPAPMCIFVQGDLEGGHGRRQPEHSLSLPRWPPALSFAVLQMQMHKGHQSFSR